MLVVVTQVKRSGQSSKTSLFQKPKGRNGGGKLIQKQIAMKSWKNSGRPWKSERPAFLLSLANGETFWDYIFSK